MSIKGWWFSESEDKTLQISIKYHLRSDEHSSELETSLKMVKKN